VSVGKYDPDSDTILRWRAGEASPDEVWLVDLGVEVVYPWTNWSAARSAADTSLSAWNDWNLNSHPDSVHRSWYATIPSERRIRLRSRARMIAASVP